MTDKLETTIITRRKLLGRLGLAAGAAYVAPVMMRLSAAHASGGSGGSSRRGGSGGRSGCGRAGGSSGPSRGTSGPSRGSRPESRGTSGTQRFGPVDMERFFRQIFLVR